MRKDRDSIIREQVDRLGRPSVEMLDREIARQERKESYRRLTRSITGILVTAVALIIIITNLWVNVLQVDGSSMNPLLKSSEIVLAVKDGSPAKGDVIAFFNNNKVYIKRVIAVSGDQVNISDDGVVTVNGQKLKEPYVTQPSKGNCDIDLPYQVPPGMFFVMGDNRPVALDSRSSSFGPVNKDQIIGKVLFRVWPFTMIGPV